MLQEQSRLFQRLLFFADALLVAVGWVAAWYVRFEVLTPPEWLPLERYLDFLPWVLMVSVFVFWASGLYAPDRAQRLYSLVFSVARAVVVGLVLLMASLSLYRTFSFSRGHMLLFGVITPSLMILLRIVLFLAITRARQQGRNIRRVLIVGDNAVGRRLAEAFAQYPWMGLEVVGFLDDQAEGPDVLGPVADVTDQVDQFAGDGRPISYVYLALPLTALPRLQQLLTDLSTRLTHVCLVPDLYQFNLFNSRLTYLDGLPVIHLIDETPLEFTRVLKRMLDVLFSASFLLLTAPLLLAIAGAVKLSSPGPVFYRQERMGLNGRTFRMLKFRSMPVDAEAATGPVWAKAGEQRATRLGAFLRRTSLDELPQFFNVLRGDMSVVGPRPERPVFIQEFKSQIPGYMLRHKMKAGITGWAQVHGWRGNTSLEKRIEYDLYYIQHWSLWLDFKIMWMTLWNGFVHKNAY
jgi:Undecaprenyl-phosphate glucose phosphotransferase